MKLDMSYTSSTISEDPIFSDRFGKMNALNVGLVGRDRKSNNFFANCCSKLKTMFSFS